MKINPTAKQILIYGDSFTFGKIPGGLRYPSDKRYTGILQKNLGDDYIIIEEGLRGRTINGENSFFPFRDGSRQFGPILGSHLPLDLIVIFLGTNDLNSGSSKTVTETVLGFNNYFKLISFWSEHLGFAEPKVLLIGPPRIDEKSSYTTLKDIFKDSEKKATQLHLEIKKYATEKNVYFFDTYDILQPSTIDGVHLDKENNEKLGKALANYIKSIL